jgi:anion-transporting  ArsA/GET3 family ATPase
MTAPGARAQHPPPHVPHAPPPPFDVDRMLDTAKILVCCGSGGVGKTTTAAALALRAAERGRRTVVLTIDPARRLAQSMGLTELDNTPRPVAGVDTSAGGSLDAMMLDMKRTFDEIVEAHAEPDKAEQIFANPFYQSLSSSFAGTQEYMAMEKLGQLKAAGQHDLVVVDTPPTRSALDFLDAPERMTTLMDGRMVRILLAPAKAGGRAYLKVVTAGFSVFTSAITRIIGAQVLQDVSQFVGALETMFGGFRERAQATYDLLKSEGTYFVVVAAPERDALREASYFVERLGEEQMPLGGLVVNRVHRSAATTLSAERALAAAEDLARRGGPDGGAGGASGDSGDGEADTALASGVLRLHAERMTLAAREKRLRERFSYAHPGVPVTEVAALPGDVHDLDGLRRIGEDLAAGREAAAPAV